MFFIHVLSMFFICFEGYIFHLLCRYVFHFYRCFSFAMGSFKINVTLWGVGGVNFPDKKHYEGVYSSTLLALPRGD